MRIVKKIFLSVLLSLLILSLFSGRTQNKPAEKDDSAAFVQTGREAEPGGGSFADEQAEPVSSGETDDFRPRMEAFSVSGYDDDGKIKWEIKGESANVGKTSKMEFHKLWVRSYHGAEYLTLTAEQGVFNQEKNTLRVEKNVVAVTTDGVRLTTEVLNWSAAEARIWGTEPCRLEKDKIVACGIGVEARMDLARAELKKDVEVRIEPETTITCSGPLQIYYEDNQVVFHDAVKVSDPRGELFADKLEVYLNPETQKIARIVAADSVRIIRDNYRVFSQNAAYSAAEDRTVLRGRPKVFIYPRKIQNLNSS